MSYLPHIWVYNGATCDDVYAQLDEPLKDIVNLDIMSMPQLAFVATDYSEDLAQKLAMDLWADIQGDYEDSFARGMPFNELEAAMSSKVTERPEGFTGEIQVLEIITWEYRLRHCNEPVIQVTVQKRPLCRLDIFGRAA